MVYVVIYMKLNWKGNWKNGEVTIDVDTPTELIEVLKNLEKEEAISKEIPTKTDEEPSVISQTIPSLPPKIGCSDAIRLLLERDWGKEPRTMAEMTEALENNALYFGKGTISGGLTTMVKRGDLRRIKKGGRWAYLKR